MNELRDHKTCKQTNRQTDRHTYMSTLWLRLINYNKNFIQISQKPSFKQVNLFKKGFGIGVSGNQHDNAYAQGEIQRQIVCVCAIKYFIFLQSLQEIVFLGPQ